MQWPASTHRSSGPLSGHSRRRAPARSPAEPSTLCGAAPGPPGKEAEVAHQARSSRPSEIVLSVPRRPSLTLSIRRLIRGLTYFQSHSSALRLSSVWGEKFSRLCERGSFGQRSTLSVATFACAPRALSSFPFASLCRNPPPWTTVANWTPNAQSARKSAIPCGPARVPGPMRSVLWPGLFSLAQNPGRRSSRDSRSMSCHWELTPLRPCLMRLIAAAESVLARLFAIFRELCRNFVPIPIEAVCLHLP